eukprot:scaffold9394_cov92-Skeletonema_dohrnii-CCMP3373.AAC.1
MRLLAKRNLASLVILVMPSIIYNTVGSRSTHTTTMVKIPKDCGNGVGCIVGKCDCKKCESRISEEAQMKIHEECPAHHRLLPLSCGNTANHCGSIAPV